MLVFRPDLNVHINYIFSYNVQILYIYGSLYAKEHLYILQNLQQLLNGLFCLNEQQRSKCIIYLIS